MAEEVEEKKAKKSGNGALMIIIIAIFVLLLVIGGLVAFLMLSSDEPKDANMAAPAQTQTQATPAQNKAKRGGNDYSNMGPIYPLDQFVVNLLSENGS